MYKNYIYQAQSREPLSYRARNKLEIAGFAQQMSYRGASFHKSLGQIICYQKRELHLKNPGIRVISGIVLALKKYRKQKQNLALFSPKKRKPWIGLFGAENVPKSGKKGRKRPQNGQKRAENGLNSLFFGVFSRLFLDCHFCTKLGQNVNPN